MRMKERTMVEAVGRGITGAGTEGAVVRFLGGREGNDLARGLETSESR